MNALKVWLYICALMILLMISIGGLTRLSDAGLSIVEWKPVTGVIPPISDSDWDIEFTKYQSSPEYKIINSHMDLSEFKHIFWLEFIHRLAARITFAVICLPLLFFYLNGRLSFQDNKSYLIMPILLLAQGVMGWYMVKSGLVLNPHVSHFRLASHLMLAVGLYSFVIWKICFLRTQTKGSYESDKALGHVRPIERVLLVLIYLQIFLGALVAGLDAGLIYNTFPLMGGHFLPSEIYSAVSIFKDPASVQFLHRFMAYIVAILALIVGFQKNNPLIILAILFQVATGIVTLLYQVPIAAALLHQLGAMILLTVLFSLVSSPGGDFQSNLKAINIKLRP
jgi:cytochrome c oxidase assembly protein subunit 15